MCRTEMQAPVAAARGLFKSNQILEGVGRGDNLALLARAAAPAPRALDRRLELRGGHLDVQREKEQALL